MGTGVEVVDVSGENGGSVQMPLADQAAADRRAKGVRQVMPTERYSGGEEERDCAADGHREGIDVSPSRRKIDPVWKAQLDENFVQWLSEAGTDEFLNELLQEKLERVASWDGSDARDAEIACEKLVSLHIQCHC